jgi:hypothetical protein
MDDRPHWFAEHARALGVMFEPPIPQRIHVLSDAPTYSGAPGSVRGEVTVADAPLLTEWFTAFHQEAVPHEAVPERHHVEKAANSGRKPETPQAERRAAGPKTDHPARRDSSSRAHVPTRELPWSFSPGDHTTIAAMPGAMARMPPPTPLFPGSPTR